jgi:endonuclease/exonuclease/phosphatase family metal-dependent hydrolase
MPRFSLILAVVVAFLSPNARADDQPTTLRVCTFNLEDVRTSDLKDANQPRLKALAAIIQSIKPDILFLNEIAYDQAGGPDVPADQPPGQNAQKFADLYLAVPQREGLAALKFRAFMAPSNTGIPSNLDLDNDGIVTSTFPAPPASDARGVASGQTAEGRAYGNDCFGFGTFPGQYAMALLVSDRFTIDAERVRTFQNYKWSAMPDAMRPPSATSSKSATPEPQTKTKPCDSWYTDAEWATLRLSSKSHWDVPVKLPSGETIHLLCSHPTPPAFDGPEGRNKRRNHDEIRFWRDYIDATRAVTLTDDKGIAGPLAMDANFIIVGDLNADPERGSSIDNPIATHLLSSPRLAPTVTPSATREVKGLRKTDTAAFKLRVDYVLPSRSFSIIRSYIHRDGFEIAVGDKDRISSWPSDHFPVVVDLLVPPVTDLSNPLPPPQTPSAPK